MIALYFSNEVSNRSTKWDKLIIGCPASPTDAMSSFIYLSYTFYMRKCRKTPYITRILFFEVVCYFVANFHP